ncbi:MAG: 3-isopropylmalate dehydrogenase [Streptosporangiales bacterium]|nr:3-isopropylmalate dehydrogenase [Streptosporangiales bacterium]
MTLRIAVLAGDGIGREVVEEALKVLDAVSVAGGPAYRLTHFPHGADHYLRTGELIGEDALRELGEHDAVFFGAIGDPRVPPRTLERGVLFAITVRYEMFLSVRPYRLHHPRLTPLDPSVARSLDLVVVREAAEDVFALPGGSIKTDRPDEVSVGTVVFTRRTVEAVVRYGFELATRRAGARRVTVVDQSNAAGVFDIWPRVLEEVAPEFPDVDAWHEAPDAFAMQLVRDPARYDVVVTSWMLGGVFADLAAALVGGLGLSGSARLNPGGLSLFEPTHGSAPKYAGKNVASPLGAIHAMAMLLDANGRPDAAALVEDAIALVLREARIPTVDARSGVPTDRQGDLVVEAIREKSARRAPR